MSQKGGSRGTMSDNASVFSDMSYQSDISGLSKAFITSAKTREARKPKPSVSEKSERAQSAIGEPSIMEPLEPIHEGNALFYRCPSPQFNAEDPLGPETKPDECEERLDVYLDEVQQYLDYLNTVEENIKD